MLSSPPCANKDTPTLETTNYELKDKNDTFTIKMDLKQDLIVINLNKNDSISSVPYSNEFDLTNLQKKANIFKLFDSIKEAYEEIKQRFKENNCTLNFGNEKITISFKTNVINSDYTLEFMPKKLGTEERFQNLYKIIDDLVKKNQNFEERLKALEKNKEEQEKLKIEKEKVTHFNESIILKNKDERDLLIRFIEENDQSKKGKINGKLLYRASRDGDKASIFHLKCDGKGATITIVKSDKGLRFGGYTSISWNASKGNWCGDGVNFLFSIDLVKYYKPFQNLQYSTYHNSSHGPTFGGGIDLYISDNCMNNNSSYNNIGYTYKKNSNYELNGGTSNFKVIDYEVFQI